MKKRYLKKFAQPEKLLKHLMVVSYLCLTRCETEIMSLSESALFNNILLCVISYIIVFLLF